MHSIEFSWLKENNIFQIGTGRKKKYYQNETEVVCVVCIDWRDFIFFFFKRIMTVVYGGVFICHTLAHTLHIHMHTLMNVYVFGDFLTTYAGQFSIFVDSLCAFIRIHLVLNIHFSIFPVQVESLRWVFCILFYSPFCLAALCQRREMSDWSFANRHGSSSVRFLISSIFCVELLGNWYWNRDKVQIKFRTNKIVIFLFILIGCGYWPN